MFDVLVVLGRFGCLMLTLGLLGSSVASGCSMLYKLVLVSVIVCTVV